MLSSQKLACWVLCVGLWSGCAGDSSGGPPRDLSLGEVSQSAKAVSASVAQTRVLAAETSLGTRSWDAVAAQLEPPRITQLKEIEWREDDAKLLLALMLKGMCRRVDGCDAWLPEALDVDAKNGVSLSAAARARLTDRIERLRRSGDERRAQAIERWLANAEVDLESVSSIGLSRSAVGVVIDGLLGRTQITPSDLSIAKVSIRATNPVLATSALSAATPGVTLPGLSAVTAGTLELAAPGLAAPADAYLVELYAQVLGITVGQTAGVCTLPGSDLPGSLSANKAADRTGTAVCAPGGGDYDSAHDTSCDNLVPGEEYCLNDEPLHEWGTLEDQIPHLMNVAFAVSARRCEPCKDGDYEFGTLRLIKNWLGQKMTRCDTTDACDPTEDPYVPDCTCL
jgi:hypothetical protein